MSGSVIDAFRLYSFRVFMLFHSRVSAPFHPMAKPVTKLRIHLYSVFIALNIAISSLQLSLLPSISEFRIPTAFRTKPLDSSSIATDDRSAAFEPSCTPTSAVLNSADCRHCLPSFGKFLPEWHECAILPQQVSCCLYQASDIPKQYTGCFIRFNQRTCLRRHSS